VHPLVRSAKNLGKYIEIKYKVGQVDPVDRRGAESSWVVRRAKSRVDRSSWSVLAWDRSSKVDSIDFGVYHTAFSQTQTILCHIWWLLFKFMPDSKVTSDYSQILSCANWGCVETGKPISGTIGNIQVKLAYNTDYPVVNNQSRWTCLFHFFEYLLNRQNMRSNLGFFLWSQSEKTRKPSCRWQTRATQTDAKKCCSSTLKQVTDNFHWISKINYF